MLVLTQPSTLIWRLSSRISKKESSHYRAYGWVTLTTDTERDQHPFTWGQRAINSLAG